MSKLAGSLSTPEQPVTLTQADLAFLSGLFEQYVDAGLALVRSGKCQEVISTVDINLVTSLTCLLQVSQALLRVCAAERRWCWLVLGCAATGHIMCIPAQQACSSPLLLQAYTGSWKGILHIIRFHGMAWHGLIMTPMWPADAWRCLQLDVQKNLQGQASLHSLAGGCIWCRQCCCQ